MHSKLQRFMHDHHYVCTSHFRARPYMPKRDTNSYRYSENARVRKPNRFVKIRCLYYIELGYTKNVCYYKKFYLNLLPLDYVDTNQPRPTNI